MARRAGGEEVGKLPCGGGPSDGKVCLEVADATSSRPGAVGDLLVSGLVCQDRGGTSPATNTRLAVVEDRGDSRETMRNLYPAGAPLLWMSMSLDRPYSPYSEGYSRVTFRCRDQLHRRIGADPCVASPVSNDQQAQVEEVSQMGRWVNVVAFRHDLGTRPIIVNVYWFDTRDEAQASHRKAKDQTEREGVVGRVISNLVHPALTIDKVDAEQGRHLGQTNRRLRGKENGTQAQQTPGAAATRKGSSTRRPLSGKRPAVGVSDPQQAIDGITTGHVAGIVASKPAVVESSQGTLPADRFPTRSTAARRRGPRAWG
jgi:hypothetical protein